LQMLIARFQILAMLGKVHHTTNIRNHIIVMYDIYLNIVVNGAA
jgi:hypothetical protein